MKLNLLKYIVAACMIIPSFSTAGAQQMRNFPRVKEILMNQQLDEIKRRINIDEKNIPEFDKLYKEYISAMSALNNEDKTPVLSQMNLNSFTDKQIEEIFLKQSDKAKKLIELREQYYYKFCKILKPRDVIVMYRTEREVVNKAQQEMRRRMMSKRLNNNY